MRLPTGRPCRLTVVVVVGGGGRTSTPLICHPMKSRGVGSMGSNATVQNVGEIRRLQNGKIHKPIDDICEVVHGGDRLSPCRSAY